ncbi:MAG: methyltransferase domain-containing protein [Proteobacteria bacterium]|nr:methyltransferase domain-containing protein [Pseudomonadota bacterium]
MTQVQGFALDKRQVRRQHQRWQVGLSPAAIPAERLWERLQMMAQNPQQALDVGGNGDFLAACYPQAQVLAVDVAPAQTSVLPQVLRMGADACALPVADASVQLLWSNLCVEWTDYRLFFAEAARVLATDGLLAFATLGPATLAEMRSVFADRTRVHDFADMHNLGDALMACGFTEPLMESEELTFTYANARDAMTETRRLGAANARSQRTSLTKGGWVRALAEYEKKYSDSKGRVRATYEVIYATAWRAQPPPPIAESPLRFYRA